MESTELVSLQRHGHPKNNTQYIPWHHKKVRFRNNTKPKHMPVRWNSRREIGEGGDHIQTKETCSLGLDNEQCMRREESRR